MRQIRRREWILFRKEYAQRANLKHYTVYSLWLLALCAAQRESTLEIGGTVLIPMIRTTTLLMAALSLTMSAIALQAASPPTTATLASEVAALQTQVKSLQTQLTAIQQNNALKLGAFVTVDPNPRNDVIGPNIVFKGANIHIVSGSGATSDNNNPTGLGNLIIGYNEVWGLAGWAYPGYRGGVHNLIMGSFNRFTRLAYATLVTGVYNTADGSNGIVDGYRNTDHGGLSVILGGAYNIIGTTPSEGISYDNVLIGGQLLVEPSSYNVMIEGQSYTDVHNYTVTLGGGTAGAIVVDYSNPTY
jgi:hypothetical protein